MCMGNKYLDESGVRYLLDKIKSLINNDSEYQEVLVSLLEKLILQDKIQRLVKLSGSLLVPASNMQTVIIPCGFDAYEIKTIKAENVDTHQDIQVEILEDDESRDVIFKSLASHKIYTSTGDVCNIDEKGTKSVYLNFINPNSTPLNISYEVKVVNLIVELDE